LLNAVSHDLRTPIASAKAAVSTLLSDEVRWSEQDRRELLGSADEALNRLTALVTNLLDLSRLQADALVVTLRPVGIDDVLSKVVATLSDSHRVSLDVSESLPEVVVDPGLIERVLANVLENALRYTPNGERVRVIGSAHGDRIVISVIDSGPGIPRDSQQAVFEPFQRRDDHAVSTGAGVGLGLAIARGFIEAMQGSITLEDTAGGGLTVIIELPAKAAGHPSVGPRQSHLVGKPPS
jgi:two-component system sensor histidine kinase KdpD